MDRPGSRGAAKRTYRVGWHSPPHLEMQPTKFLRPLIPKGSVPSCCIRKFSRSTSATSRDPVPWPGLWTLLAMAPRRKRAGKRGTRQLRRAETLAKEMQKEGRAAEICGGATRGTTGTRRCEDEPVATEVPRAPIAIRKGIGAPPGLELEPYPTGRAPTASVSGSTRSRSHAEPESDVAKMTSSTNSEADDPPPQGNERGCSRRSCKDTERIL